MPKIDYGYVDFVDYLLQKNEADLTTELSRKDYEIANELGDKRSIYRLYFEAPFQVFLDAGKDVADTFKPYKRFGQFGKNLAQPLFGFANLLRGLVNVIGTAILFFPAFFYHAFVACCTGNAGHLVKIPARHASWLLHGITLANRGITQIATIPLSWIKILLRSAITLFNKEEPKAENNQRIKDLARKGHEIIDKAIETENKNKNKPNYKDQIILHKKENVEAVINTLCVKYKKNAMNYPTDVENIDAVYQKRYGKTEEDYSRLKHLNIKQMKKARAVFNLFVPHQKKEEEQQPVAEHTQTQGL